MLVYIQLQSSVSYTHIYLLRKPVMKLTLSTILLILFSLGCNASIESSEVNYQHHDTKLQGYIAAPKDNNSTKPAILVVHDWMGLSDFTKNKANQLADLGYISFAVDIYGEGIRPKNSKEAGKLASFYKDDRKLMRERTKSAYDLLVKQNNIDPNNIYIMGYCFGGTVALEFARSGAILAGAVSFHGGLETPTPEDAKNIKGRILVLHGLADPLVPPDEVEAFKNEMKAANVDLTFIGYPNAKHAFTNPNAKNSKDSPIGYDKDADQKSWAAFLKFLKESQK